MPLKCKICYKRFSDGLPGSDGTPAYCSQYCFDKWVHKALNSYILNKLGEPELIEPSEEMKSFCRIMDAFEEFAPKAVSSLLETFTPKRRDNETKNS